MKKFLYISLVLLFINLLKSQENADSTIVQTDSTQIINANEPQDGATQTFFLMNTNLGTTLQSVSQSDLQDESMVWLLSFNSKLGLDYPVIHFYSSLFVNYGQTLRKNLYPEKNADDFILTLTPSISLVPASDIRLFLDVTAETDLTEGIIDDQITTFFDPAYLNTTVYVGKMSNQQNSDNSKFHLFYGVGFSFQSTITNKFILVENRGNINNPDNPLSGIQDRVTFDSGLAMIFDMDYIDNIGESFNYNFSWKNVLYTKDSFWKEISKNRFSSLMQIGLSYKIFSINYLGKLLFDGDLSNTRQLNQSLVFGLNYQL